MNDERYEDYDAFAVLCRDCSTRAHGVLIPREEQYEHDAWHYTQEMTADMPASDLEKGSEQ